MKPKDEQVFFKEIGERLARARKSQGYTQEKMADLTGLDRVAIGYIEQGRRRPTVTTIYKISKALGIKLEQIFRGY